MKGQRGSEPSWACPVQSADPDWAQRALRPGAEVGTNDTQLPGHAGCQQTHETGARTGPSSPPHPAWPLGLSSLRQPLPCPTPPLTAGCAVSTAQD